MRIEEREALAGTLVGEYTGTDSILITVTLPHRLPSLIQRNVGKKWVRTLLKRTNQSLKDSGGGELSAVYAEVRKPLTCKGSEVHYHILAKGKGLDGINKEKIIQRWNQITGKEIRVQKQTKLTKIRVPDPEKTENGFLKSGYMKNGEVVTRWKEVPHVEVISEGTKFVDCGTCDVRDAKDYHARYITSMKNISSPDQLSFWGNTPRMQA